MLVKTSYETLFDSMYSLSIPHLVPSGWGLNLSIMASQDSREVWQRGPLDGIPPLLQPVAHALLQAVEEATRFTENFPDNLLWEKPSGVASVGFHLLHIKGVLDRLFTYARGEMLTVEQLKALAAEQEIPAENISVSELLDQVRQQVERALRQLRTTDEKVLLQGRTIGRKQIPTNVIGLLFHAAEHTQRHVGQLIVTSRVQIK
jgi:uncharacterized damage-inducible protein DinB